MRKAVIEIREHPANNVGAHWAAYLRAGTFDRKTDPIAEGDTLPRLINRLVAPWAHLEPVVKITGDYGLADFAYEVDPACIICGSNLDIEEMPSMMGYGTDSTVACRNCDAHQTDNPLTGQSSIYVNLAGFALSEGPHHATRSER